MNISRRAGTIASLALVAALSGAGLAHSQTISAVAGNGTYGFSGDGGPAISASLGGAYGIAVDSVGNRYISDMGNSRIRKITPNGTISTYAGNGIQGNRSEPNGDGGPATSARLGNVYLLATDSRDNLYLPDAGLGRIRKITPSGTITTVVGNGMGGFGGDGGPAVNAQVYPVALTFDTAGNMYFSDLGNMRVRKVSPAGVISTIAGNGFVGSTGDGGPATSASLNYPLGIAVDRNGNVFVAENGSRRVRKITPAGIISTVAGTDSGFSGDGGPAVSARLSYLWDLGFDKAGNLYISDSGNGRIRKVDKAGVITTFAGNGGESNTGDGGPAAAAQIGYPTGLYVGGGYVHFSSYLHVRKVTLFDSCSAEGFSGTKLTVCRQVCESTLTSTNLSAMIKLYSTLYGTEPPCAR